MTNAWDEMKRAKEEQYFDGANKKLLAKLQERGARLSPITGEAMEQIVLDGVTVDRCPKSGGLWLDAGELEQLLKNAASAPTWTTGFLERIFRQKK